jgi:oligogalacturonide transport system substrate-binding protein
MIEEFEKQNPGIKIEPEYSAFAQYRDKFTIQLTSGAAPDVMAVDQPWCDSIVKQGDFFLNLDSYADELKIDTFDSYLIDSYSRFNGKTLFLPVGINGMGSLADAEKLTPYGFDINNKDFTWDELFALAAKVRTANPSQYLCVVDSKQASLYYARVYLRQLTGKQLINDDGSMGVTREELGKSFELVDRCYKEGVFQPIRESAVYNDAMTQNPEWLNRNMFMILGRTSVMTDTSARRPINGAPTTVGYVLPQLPNGKESGIEVRPAALYAINKNTKVADAAIKFLSFMLTSEEAAKAIGSNYSIPAREESRAFAQNYDLLEESSLENVEYSLAHAGNTINAWSANPEVEALFTEIMEKIAYNQYKNMLEAADEAIARINIIVSAGL